ncbi:MAG: hypothetical protein JWQ04_1195 [Pedosphaera sp.]|nr:hypothetical protein [Pedosphaera sp.]
MQNFTFNFPGMGEFSVVVSVFIAIAYVVLHVLFFSCIWNDAKRLELTGRPPVLLPPFAWGLAALLTGLMAVALYWVAHYSNLARKEGPASP